MRASADSLRLYKLLADNSDAIRAVFNKYGASNPRVFGSVARGDAHPGSDIDIMVDIEDSKGATIMKLAGISESLYRLLGVRVDVVTPSVLREKVSAEAQRELVAI
ncbi:nucleotidyltransferase family protein [Rothia sp. 11254D007CT]